MNQTEEFAIKRVFGVIIDSFSSKMDVFENVADFYVLQHSNFPAFSTQRQTNSLRTLCILAFQSLVNMLSLHFSSLLNVLFLWCSLQKYTFQVVSFRIERTISLSRLAKVFKLISLFNLHPRIKEFYWRLLDLRLLAKTAQ